MKPKNFPERINERRKVALAHLFLGNISQLQEKEREELEALIRPSRRHERSKKTALDVNGIPARHRKPRGIKP